MAASKLILVSPLQGWSAPLEETPDPVFAGHMMGDGVAIDPTGTTSVGSGTFCGSLSAAPARVPELRG